MKLSEATQDKPVKLKLSDVSVVEKPEVGPVMGASVAEMIPTDGYPKAPKPTVMAGEPSYLEKASMYAAAVPATASESAARMSRPHATTRPTRCCKMCSHAGTRRGTSDRTARGWCRLR